MSDHLDFARDLLRDGATAAASAHAAVDAAETLRRVENMHAGLVKALDVLAPIVAQGASAPHDGATNPGEGSRERGGVTRGAPDAPVTPQEGEVWEDARDGERVMVTGPTDDQGWTPIRILRGPDAHGNDRDGGEDEYMLVEEGWHRVSPAPAPLTERERVVADGLAAIAMTEREVTAEAETQGVAPASDEQIAYWHGCLMLGEVPDEWMPPIARLIARVRAEQARAEDAELRCAGEVRSWQAFRERAEAAEAEVALLRPVVAESLRLVDTKDFEHYAVTGRLRRAVLAYRESAGGE